MNNIGPLSTDKIPDYFVQSPWEGIVRVMREEPDRTAEECGSTECEDTEQQLHRRFWEGERRMPDIIDPNQIIRYRYECEGCLGKCAMQLVQYSRVGQEITRIQNI